MSKAPRRFSSLGRHRALPVGGVPVLRRKPDTPKARGLLREANSDHGFPIYDVTQGYHIAGDFFIRLHVRQEERLLLDHGRRKLDEAAIGIDRNGLGNFLEGRTGFIIPVNKYWNSDVHSGGSLPCSFGVCHIARNEFCFDTHLPREGYGTTL
jgi:hypothetical protein